MLSDAAVCGLGQRESAGKGVWWRRSAQERVRGGWLLKPLDGRVNFDTMWWHYSFYSHFVEDIDEFAKVADVGQDIDWSPMGKISESAFKQCVAEILGDGVTKDWGGERSDHFSSRVHLKGRRVNAAFLFKGPGGGFGPMHMPRATFRPTTT